MPSSVDPLSALRSRFLAVLAARYPESEILAIWKVWLQKRVGISPAQRLLQSPLILAEGLEQQARHDLEALASGMPLQYVLNEAWFLGRPYVLNHNVLIPRPETEELVLWILEQEPHARCTAVDLGCGSGIIPISLKLSRPSWQLYGLDLSAEALRTAAENAALHQADIHWLEADMLQAQLPEWDVLISNPPYIGRDEAAAMREEVLAHEPDMALFAPGNDALLFYRHIAQLARKATAGRRIYLELNHEKAPEIQGLFHAFDCELRQDMQGKSRMLRITT